LFAKPRRLIGNQQHKEAAEIFAKMVKLDPKNATAWQLISPEASMIQSSQIKKRANLKAQRAFHFIILGVPIL
jgi:cytochrome c-type biogenesis protein CcmH/NrfG